jgi:D-3-phosphoglycerate dehydrogenase|tara:strand:- start:1581 stop:2456 length:876 start_codon:yes stop_codon:yes gene_type:complete
MRLLDEKNKVHVVSNTSGMKLTAGDLINRISQFDGVIAGTESYDKDVIDVAEKLKVISRVGVGLDNIDLDYARKKGINVFKTQTTPAPAVAELTLGLILDLLRKISIQNSNMKSGNWKKKMGSLLRGKTLGIIGLGTVGKELVRITSNMQLEYLAFDVIKDNEFSNSFSVKYCDLTYLLNNSDIISVHLSLSDENTKMIGLEQLRKMKNSSILINTSRGEVINEDDLEIAIRDGIIAGAGLDVFQMEPYHGPFSAYDNVILTPHIGSYAREIREAMEIEAVQNLFEGFNKS